MLIFSQDRKVLVNLNKASSVVVYKPLDRPFILRAYTDATAEDVVYDDVAEFSTEEQAMTALEKIAESYGNERKVHLIEREQIDDNTRKS